MAFAHEDCSDDFSSLTELQETFDIENLLHITEKGVLKWEGSFEVLKRFFDSFLKTDTKWSTPRGNCKQHQSENGLDIRWYSTTNSLCIDGPAGESLKTQLNILVRNFEQKSDNGDGEISVESSSVSISNHAHPNIEGCDHLSASPQDIVEIVKQLEHRMNEKMGELSKEIEQIKLINSCKADMSQVGVDSIVQENASLKAENKVLLERCESLAYAMGSLKKDVNSLEEEKKSLLTVVKLLQADVEYSQQKSTDKQHSWNKVNKHTAQKHTKSLSDKNNEMQISNRFEILSDSDDNNNIPETIVRPRRQSNINKRSAQTDQGSDQDKNLNSSKPTASVNTSHQNPEGDGNANGNYNK